MGQEKRREMRDCNREKKTKFKGIPRRNVSAEGTSREGDRDRERERARERESEGGRERERERERERASEGGREGGGGELLMP